jgi:peroxiredoxin Q/BCP
MTIPKLGEPARPFRLPAAQGGEIGLDDFKGRQSVVVWFTKGMACVFCRQQMSQLLRAYPRIKDRGGEVLQVTTSTPSRARFYAEKFTLPFPYLCDPEFQVFRAWGLEKRPHGPAYYAKTLVEGLRRSPVENDFGEFKPALTEVPRLLTDDDMGFFVVDRGGTVRYALAGPYMHEAGVRGIPGGEEIVRELDRCSAAA